MYPVKYILQLLLGGVERIPPGDRPDALCAMFAGLLPEMAEPDILEVRDEVIRRFWHLNPTVDPVINLIDGHLMLRSLLPSLPQPEMDEANDGSDFSV